MTCTNCETAREFPDYRMFNPACLHCGARLIQLLGRMPIGNADCTARRRQVLVDWMARGHSEADLRRLAKGPLALSPTGQVKPTASAPHTPSKPRCRGQK